MVHDDGGPGLSEVAPRTGDAVVLCDHDAPDAPAVLRAALASEASYVAMMASRRRADRTAGRARGRGRAGLTKLHVPAGHDLGGKGPGEIALSVVAEIVAEAHGRPAARCDHRWLRRALGPSRNPGQASAVTGFATGAARPPRPAGPGQLTRAVSPVGPPGAPWQRLYFLPDPQGHSWLRPTSANSSSALVAVAPATSASPCSDGAE